MRQESQTKARTRNKKANQMRDDDLAHVKPGDRVALIHRGEAYAIKTVDHTTTNYIFVGPIRYRRRDGSPVSGGGSWDSPRIAVLNGCYKEQVMRAKTIARLHNFNWKLLDTQTLTNVLALLPAEKDKIG